MWCRTAYRLHRTLMIPLSVSLLLVSSGGFVFAKTQLPIEFKYQTENVAVDRPFVIEFNQDVKPNFAAEISPGVEGTWKVARTPLGASGIVFTPKTFLDTGGYYSVRITGLRRVLTDNMIHDGRIKFSTENAPEIVSFRPANGATSVPIDTNFALKLATKNRGLRDLTIRTEPGVGLALAPSLDDQNFIWKTNQKLKQSTEYKVFIEDRKVQNPKKRLLLTGAFRTVNSPKVKSATNKDHFYPDEKVVIEFSENMLPREDTFEFDFKGSGSWVSQTTYEYRPVGLVPANTYRYRVTKKATAVTGGVLEQSAEFSITTPGAVYVTATSPGGSGVKRNAQVKFSFDQPVNKVSAEKSFSISPKVDGSLSWTGNTLIFSHKDFEYQARYTATAAAGIESVYGLSSTRAYNFSFETELKTTLLSVPYFKQAYPQSCEAASLRMALAYKGISVSDLDIVNVMGYNPRPRDTANNSWDSPYEMFVGDLNGQQNSTGFGVYAGRTAYAARQFGRNATDHPGVTANFIAQQILSDSPVVLWGVSSKHRPDSWNTSSGVVQAPVGEHTRTVVGVVGRADAPAAFYVNDPVAGQLYWTTAQLLANLNTYSVLNQAVVVY